MYNIVMAFGLAGVVLAIGIVFRAKIKFFQNILMPAPVIGGIIGFIIMNLFKGEIATVSTYDYSTIVDLFFIFSFIGIGLGSKSENDISKEEKKKLTKKEKKARRNNTVFHGAISLGLVWCAIYGLQAIVGGISCAIIGKPFKMDGMYGILLSFGFSQGPGQSSSYGQLFEKTYGYKDAEMISIAFAVAGFLAAFLVGVPVARYGLKKGIAKKACEIGEIEKRGYYKEDENGRSLGRATTYGGNVETLATHFAFMGISYILAIGLSELVKYVPGIGETFAAMKFFWGMIAATFVRSFLKALNIEYILNDMLLSRITAFFTDFVVICAFMSVRLEALGLLIIPIIITSAICAVVTFFVAIYFCERMGSDHDFEKFLGLYGTSTGTISSGISLIRIVDPMLTTPTSQEVGCINMVGILSAPIITFASLAGTGTLSFTVALVGIAASVVIDLVALKLFGGWRKEKNFLLSR